MSISQTRITRYLRTARARFERPPDANQYWELTDRMQVLVYKSPILDLAMDPIAAGVAVGTKASLDIQPDGAVAVVVHLPSRWPFGLGADRDLRVGTLDPRITTLLAPALEKNAALRVRIVEVEPAHMSRHARPALYISVWGTFEDLKVAPRMHPIFTKSRINDLPPTWDQDDGRDY